MSVMLLTLAQRWSPRRGVAASAFEVKRLCGVLGLASLQSTNVELDEREMSVDYSQH